jgi:hypothetical protein
MRRSRVGRLSARRRVVFTSDESGPGAAATVARAASSWACVSAIVPLVAMAEVVLGKRAVESAAYQTSVTICAGCSRTLQRAGGVRAL